MSTKPIDSRTLTPRMEVLLKGTGAATFALFDQKGNVLLTKRLVLSGSDAAEAKSRLPLTLRTRAGSVPVVPVLIHKANQKQTVTFAGKDAVSATAERYRELRVSKAAIAKIGQAMLLAEERGGDPDIILSLGRKSAGKRR
jgi:hypothetical protein